MSSGQVRAELRHAIRANGDDLLRYFERRVSVREDAADLLAETMGTAWRRLDAMPVGDAIRQRMWLYGIASRLHANHARGKRRYRALVERLRGELGATPMQTPDGAEAQAVRDAVKRLPDELRELIALIHWDGFTVAEAADVLSLNASTARGRYATARARLREALADVPETDGDRCAK